MKLPSSQYFMFYHLVNLLECRKTSDIGIVLITVRSSISLSKKINQNFLAVFKCKIKKNSVLFEVFDLKILQINFDINEIKHNRINSD